MIKYTRLWLFFIAALAFMSSCTDDDDDSTAEDGNWIKRSSFEGVARSGAVAFVVGDKAYVGLGYDGDDYLTDFWSYDPELNFWQQVADFPGAGRSGAVAFSVDGKGYVGTGYDGDDEVKDFWSYDVESNTWKQIPEFGGSARVHAVAYSVGGLGYVATGFDGNYLKDVWSYNPTDSSWVQVVSVKGEKRANATVFNIDDEVYLGTGSNNGIYQTDFWHFDAVNQDWLEQEDLDVDDDYFIVREGAVAFSVGEFGYITTGVSGSNLNSTWQYDPIVDEWEEKTAFEGSSRQYAVGFTVNGRAYVALGQNSSSRFDDVWEFRPLEEYDDED